MIESKKANDLDGSAEFPHMTKGQRAMAVAMIYPNTEQGKKATSSKTEEVGGTYLSYARTVLKHAPDLAVNVLAGSASLDGAYNTARDRKDGARINFPWVPSESLRAKRREPPDYQKTKK